MKLTALFLLLTSLNSWVWADDMISSLANTYEHASLPNFLPHVGNALSGRCYLATGANKKIASVLMVSFEEEGFEVAPFDEKNKREDFFDKMSYEDILKQFPLIKNMFLEVSETADGAVVEKDKGSEEYKGELRENEKYMIMRVFRNGKIFKYCNYVK
ncbi:MAG: hypothetical protein PHY93_03420 [Bacteriovorax sp.]|nr:hypothetical protein [Bacteriovorax sp.]